MTLPHHEALRLQTLHRYAVLNASAEQALGGISVLASQVCQTPFALISFVDDHHQWFKAQVGLVIDRMSHEHSLCSQAIAQKELLIVPDARIDARFSANPLVTGDPGVRFYAGSPLVMPEGHAIGVLCVMDRVPRDLTAAQAQGLQTLSRQVVAQLELRRLLMDRHAAEESLHSAHELHRLLLNELDHRVKNNLTSLMSLIDLSARNKTSVPDFAQTMKARVRTMASAHHLLSASRWTPVDLLRFLEELTPLECIDKVSFTGPDVLIPPRQLTALGMVVQELLTNSLKYGALSAEDGCVVVEWSVSSNPLDGRKRLVFAWTESGGPAIRDTNPLAGQGTDLIVGLVRSELRGEARLSYPPEGARHVFVFHLDHIGDPLRPAVTPRPSDLGPHPRPRADDAASHKPSVVATLKPDDAEQARRRSG